MTERYIHTYINICVCEIYEIRLTSILGCYIIVDVFKIHRFWLLNHRIMFTFGETKRSLIQLHNNCKNTLMKFLY